MEQILETANDWQQFVWDKNPVTIIMGLDRALLADRLVPYPENKVNTRGNVIPYVEVCHRGTIPLCAAMRYLLVCHVDCFKFYPEEVLTQERLAEVEDGIAEGKKRPLLGYQAFRHIWKPRVVQS
ncbi:MAG: hypothetical protein ABI651_09645 [Verrucomicrobiota bacterium]